MIKFRLYLYIVRLLFSVGLAAFRTLNGAFVSKLRVSYLTAKLFYRSHKADIIYSFNCKYILSCQRQSKEAEAESDCRLRKNKEIADAIRENKAFIYQNSCDYGNTRKCSAEQGRTDCRRA